MANYALTDEYLDSLVGGVEYQRVPWGTACFLRTRFGYTVSGISYRYWRDERAAHLAQGEALKEARERLAEHERYALQRAGMRDSSGFENVVP